MANLERMSQKELAKLVNDLVRFQNQEDKSLTLEQRLQIKSAVDLIADTTYFLKNGKPIELAVTDDQIVEERVIKGKKNG